MSRGSGFADLGGNRRKRLSLGRRLRILVRVVFKSILGCLELSGFPQFVLILAF